MVFSKAMECDVLVAGAGVAGVAAAVAAARRGRRVILIEKEVSAARGARDLQSYLNSPAAAETQTRHCAEACPVADRLRIAVWSRKVVLPYDSRIWSSLGRTQGEYSLLLDDRDFRRC
jgi:flavin-dependent dehydrogenase